MWGLVNDTGCTPIEVSPRYPLLSKIKFTGCKSFSFLTFSWPWGQLWGCQSICSSRCSWSQSRDPPQISSLATCKISSFQIFSFFSFQYVLTSLQPPFQGSLALENLLEFSLLAFRLIWKRWFFFFSQFLPFGMGMPKVSHHCNLEADNLFSKFLHRWRVIWLQ